MRRTMDILPEVETIRVEANGITFEVDTMGEGDRLVLCLHGFPEHSVSWRFQMPFLAKLGYRVWAPNMRGYGNTDAPKGPFGASVFPYPRMLGAHTRYPLSLIHI